MASDPVRFSQSLPKGKTRGGQGNDYRHNRDYLRNACCMTNRVCGGRGASAAPTLGVPTAESLGSRVNSKAAPRQSVNTAWPAN